MKKQLILCFALVALAISTKAQSTFDKWPELKAFHNIMSTTFHPAEEGNLKPIKEKSTELAESAAKLQTSLMPKEFNTTAIKASVKKLATESKTLDALIKKKPSDAIILKNLTALHNRFHEIVGLCKEEKH
jgi:hypothetical protein